jgi:hypothetical protein
LILVAMGLVLTVKSLAQIMSLFAPKSATTT